MTTYQRHYDRPIVRIGLRITGGLFLLCAIPAMYASISDLREAFDSEGWPQAEGVVREIDAPADTIRGNEGHFRVSIKYEYTVNGQKRFGDRINNSNPSVGEETRDEYFRKYAVGNTVTVWYAPDLMGREFLEPGPSAGNWGFVAFACFVLPGFAVFLLWPHKPVEPEPSDDSLKHAVAPDLVPEPSRDIFDDGILFAYEIPKRNRVIDVVGRTLLLGIVAWVGILFVLQVGLMPDAEPQVRGRISTFVAVPVAVVVLVLALRSTFGFAVSRESLLIRAGRGVTDVSLQEIRGLIGRAGPCFDGGDMVVWRSLVVLSESGRRHVLKFHPQVNEQLFRALMQLCPHTVGVPFRGEPEASSGVVGADVGACVGGIRKVLTAHLIRLASFAALLLTSSIVVCVLAILSENDDQVGKELPIREFSDVMLLLIAAFGVGCAVGIQCLRELRLICRLKTFGADAQRKAG